MAEVIGFIGLGRMGRPLAANLARKGFDLVVFDLLEDAVARLVSEGAKAATSAAETAAQSDILVTMLPNSSHVQSVVEQDVLSNLRRGGIVVDMSTIDPGVTDQIAATLRQSGFGFADAPVGRSTLHAERGEVLFMVGAEAPHFARIKPMLDAMGSTVVHCGPPGSGIRIKIVNNFLAISMAQLNAEALTLGATLGLDIEVELEVLNGTTAGNGFLKFAFPDKTLSGDIEPGFMIDLAHKDISIAIDAANRLKVPLAMGSVAREVLNIARARGYGGKDFTALIDNWTELAGVPKPSLKPQS